MLKDFKTIIGHVFSKKALTYRAFAFTWVFLVTYFSLKYNFHAITIATIIVIGKTVMYGTWEHFHYKKCSTKENWTPINSIGD